MNKTSMEILAIVKSSDHFDDAMSEFLLAPSFSTKQKAIELLLRNISTTGISKSS